MPYSGTNPESYITEYTLVYEGKFHEDTGLDDFALVEDDDFVGVDHRREPVRDHDRRPPL